MPHLKSHISKHASFTNRNSIKPSIDTDMNSFVLKEDDPSLEFYDNTTEETNNDFKISPITL